MNTRRITIFFACVIAALAVICALYPADGITVGDHSFYLPNVHTLVEQLEDEEPETNATAAMDSVESEELAELSDSITYFQTFIDSSDLRLWLPDSLYLARFWEAAEKASSQGRILRVLHYGDSQIEMDRMTSRLRNYMQQTFGGGGPGMMPYRTLIPTYAVHQSCVGEMAHLSSFGDSTVVRSRGNYGPMMQCFRMNGAATVTFKGATQSFTAPRIRQFSNVRVVYNSRSGHLASILTDRQSKRSDTLVADTTGVGSFAWQLDSASKNINIRTTGDADLYCVTLDDGPGVAVDNIPMRGCSGQQFTLVNSDLFTEAYRQLDVGMIILQFGGNSVPYLQTAEGISRYCTSLGRQIDHLHRCCPQACILFVGPSDMSTRIKSVMQTYPLLPALIDSLAATATSHGAAFWSIYHAMGGRNSMIHWNQTGLAVSDYIHFTQRGADEMGDKLVQALSDNYQLYTMRRRLKNEKQ